MNTKRAIDEPKQAKLTPRQIRMLFGRVVTFYNAEYGETFTATPTAIERRCVRTADGGLYHYDELQILNVQY